MKRLSSFWRDTTDLVRLWFKNRKFRDGQRVVVDNETIDAMIRGVEMMG